MTNSLFLLFLISAIVYWFSGWFLIPRIKYCSARGREKYSGSVSIIIPARNEENRISPLLNSLKKENVFSRFEVILADDDSTDRTVELAEKAGCRIVSAGEKPDAAVGKSWACAAGADAATGEVLVFMDADAVLMPGGIDSILAEYGCGLLSVQPYHRFRRFYESFSAFFNLMSAAGVNSFSLHSRGNNILGAFGPCMLCSRTDYEKTGGHRAIMKALVDDIALASLFRKKNLCIKNYAGKKTIEYRMYPEGIKSLWQGWSKNMAIASSASSRLSRLYFGIWCAGIANIALTAAFADSAAGMAAAAIVYLVYSVQLFINLRRLGSWNIMHALIFPVYLLFFLAILSFSAFSTRVLGTASWKGRKIKL